MTTPSEQRLAALLHMYTFGRLSDAEQDELFTAAAGDSAIYSQLMEAEDLRAALEAPAERRKLLDALPTRKSQLARLRWMAVAWALSGACAGLLVLVAVNHFAGPRVEIARVEQKQPSAASQTPPVSTPGKSVPKTVIPEQNIIGAGRRTSDPLQSVFDLDPQRSLRASASLQGGVPVVTPGGALSLSVTSPAPATAWVFERGPAGPVNAVTSPAGLRLDANRTVRLNVPLGSQEGGHIVRVVVLSQPAQLYRDGKLDVTAITGPTAVLDLRGQVLRP
jgi:hypothetical protein